MADDALLRNAGRFAWNQGFAGGFSNFHEADYGKGRVRGVFQLPDVAVSWQDVGRQTLAAHDSGVSHMDNVPAVTRAVNRWCVANGASGGIPTFEQADHGAGVVLGVLKFKPGAVEWRDVPLSVIKAPRIEDVPAMMRGAADYAAAQGFAGAFPTFEQANYGQGVVVGINLIKPGYAVWRDVYQAILDFQSKFSFDPAAGFTGGEIRTVMERWAFAYDRMVECGRLGATVIAKVKSSFAKSIPHDLSAAADANASAPVNGSEIHLNRANFFSLIAREQAQTLLHEMTHLAGFSHPDRRDCPPGSPPTCVADVPFDNGPYYSTVPLQAELCIAGVQSDAACCDTPTGPGPQPEPTPRVIGIDYNPPGSDIDREYVNILHSGSAPVQLTGWTLKDSAGHKYTFPSFTLLPGNRVKVWSGHGTDNTENLFWGREQAVWNNRGGDVATLADSAGAVRHQFAYQS